MYVLSQYSWHWVLRSVNQRRFLHFSMFGTEKLAHMLFKVIKRMNNIKKYSCRFRDISPNLSRILVWRPRWVFRSSVLFGFFFSPSKMVYQQKYHCDVCYTATYAQHIQRQKRMTAIERIVISNTASDNSAAGNVCNCSYYFRSYFTASHTFRWEFSKNKNLVWDSMYLNHVPWIDQISTSQAHCSCYRKIYEVIDFVVAFVRSTNCLITTPFQSLIFVLTIRVVSIQTSYTWTIFHRCSG